MYHLIIDTSTERASVVFAKKEKVVEALQLPLGMRSSQFLFDALQDGFKKLSIKPTDLGFVSVTTGPGLFTGIRVGVAAAKGIAYGAKVPLFGLCALSSFVSGEEGTFFSAIDGRSQGVFLLEQSCVKGIIEESCTMKLATLDEVKDLETLFVGPNFDRIQVKNSLSIWPSADHLAYLAYQKGVKSSHKSHELKLTY